MIYTTTIPEVDEKKRKKNRNFISLNSSVEFMVKSWKIANVVTISYEFGSYIYYYTIDIGTYTYMFVLEFCLF